MLFVNDLMNTMGYIYIYQTSGSVHLHLSLCREMRMDWCVEISGIEKRVPYVRFVDKS